MEKKIVKVLFVFGLLNIVACNKFLDVNPKFKFADTIALSSLNGLALTTTGAFHQLQSGNLYAGGIVANSELLADFVNTDPISDFNLNQFRSHQLNSLNSQVSGMWGDAYRAIYIANVVLQNLPRFKGENPALEQTIAGECYFIRGIMFYELVRMFAQPSGYTSDDSHPGIPLVLTPGALDSAQSTPRSTVAQVYAQVVSDLQQAEQMLPSDPHARASVYAVQAFLTKVYFSQNKFTDAKSYADKVISGGFALDSTGSIFTLSTLDNPGVQNSEAIFQLKAVTTDNLSTVLYGRFRTIPFHPAQCRTSDLFNSYLSSDSALGGYRYKLLYKRQRVGSVFYNYTRKYDNISYVPVVIRLAEILLDRAECNAQLGASDAEVLADYNLIRVRAGLLPDNTTSGKQALLSAIRGERDYELAFEGDRFYELKRRQQTFAEPDGSFYPWNDPKLVYPIPQQEVDQNKNMTQNPGY